jgi:hypothetical protein
MIKPQLLTLFFSIFISTSTIEQHALLVNSFTKNHTFNYNNFSSELSSLKLNLFTSLFIKISAINSTIPIRKLKAQPLKAEDVRSAYSFGCPQGVIIKTSSTLPNTGVIQYSPENLLDDSAQTAWSEGDAGDGIGTFIEFSVIDKISIGDRYLVENGYAKNKSTYSSCNRVKTLQLNVNETEVAQIELADTFLPQAINLNPSGWQKININKGDKLKFIIKEIYKGSDRNHTFLSTFTPLCK